MKALGVLEEFVPRDHRDAVLTQALLLALRIRLQPSMDEASLDVAMRMIRVVRLALSGSQEVDIVRYSID